MGNPLGNRQRILGAICAADGGLSAPMIRELTAPPRTDQEVAHLLDAYVRGGLITHDRGVYYPTHAGYRERDTWVRRQPTTPRMRTRRPVDQDVQSLLYRGPVLSAVAHDALGARGWSKGVITHTFKRLGVVHVNHNGVKWRCYEHQIEDIPETWARERLTYRLVQETNSSHPAVRRTLDQLGPTPPEGYTHDVINAVTHQLEGING